jgi:MarR family transcriptional regulator, transcriptional regulator for hemolysin
MAHPPEISLGWLLHDVARLFRLRFEQRARAEGLGLTRAQAAVLGHLMLNEGINQASLAQLLEIEPITLVRLLDKLEAAGLVERRADPSDRRARTLHLKPAAMALITHSRAIGKEVMEDAMAGVPEAQRAAYRDIMMSMKSNLLAVTTGDSRSVSNG